MSKLADKFAKFFHDADVNKNGYLDITEVVASMRIAGFTGTDQEIRRKFFVMDTSRDDKVTFDEYLGSVGKQPDAVLKEAMMRYLFRNYDKNESGFLEKSDIEATFKECDLEMTEADTSRIMTLMDLNKDGKVDYEEFLKYYQK